MSWPILDQILVSALNFVIGIAIARALGTAEFGRITLILLLAAQAGVFQEYVLSAPMMTLIGRRARRTPHYFGAILTWGVLSSLLGAVAVALAIAVLFFLRDGVLSILVPMSAFAVSASQNIHAIVRRVLFAQCRGRDAFILDAVRYVLLGVAALSLGLTPRDTSIDATTVLLTLAGSALIATLPFAALTRWPRVSKRLMTRVIGRHWPIARWLVLMVLASTGQEQVVPIILSLTLGDEAVGGLRAGQYLLGGTHFILMAIVNFVPRRASESFTASGPPGLLKYMIKETVALGLPTLALILLIGIPAEFWLALLFGSDYVQFVPILRIFCLSYVAIFIRDLWIYYLRTIERTRGTFNAFLASSTVSVMLAYPAIRYAGTIGAAWVVLIANIVSMLYILFEVRRQQRLF